jgi:membrane-bound lytic murein transglycosylase B
MRFLLIILSMLSIPAWAGTQVDTAAHNPKAFGVWLDELKKEARSQGIKQETIDTAFKDTEFLDNVIKLDRKQPEDKITLYEYLQNSVGTQRIVDGKEKLEEYKDILNQVEAKFGVDKEAIVALWGIETNYGENTGNFSTIDTLATLAYDGRRADFFRTELFNALKIADADHIGAAEMYGSWAGAMGQCQFMPSTFLKYAYDYNGDGKRDIWTTEPDVFASIANYLHDIGWVKGGELAMPVKLPDGFDMALTDKNLVMPVSEWRKRGVVYNDGSELPDVSTDSSVIMVGSGEEGVPYIVYNNFKVILEWNRSRYFATAVDMLMEELK